jgi:hypothetical protein
MCRGNFFEEIINCMVYRDGDKPTIVRPLIGGGRSQNLGFQCITNSGLLIITFFKGDVNEN